MILTAWNRNTQSKSYLRATPFTTYPKWIDLGRNQRLRAERPADWQSVTELRLICAITWWWRKPTCLPRAFITFRRNQPRGKNNIY